MNITSCTLLITNSERVLYRTILGKRIKMCQLLHTVLILVNASLLVVITLIVTTIYVRKKRCTTVLWNSGGCFINVPRIKV